METRDRSRSPSILASSLQRDAADVALAMVDEHLGTDFENSPLLAFRMQDASQADWKEEVGHWLLSAQRLGFLPRLVHDVRANAERRRAPAEHLANDKGHIAVRQALAPALLAHYLVGTDFTFLEWEPPNIDGDVDLRVCAPDGKVVAIQVKASDQPGGRSGGRIVDGEHDERVIKGLEKGCAQLPKAGKEAQMVVMNSQRLWTVAVDPMFVVDHLYGSTIGYGDGIVVLPADRLGRFHHAEWNHVGAVLLIDYVRSVEFTYACTVLLNPWCREDVRCEERWFPHARVCVLEGDTFRWKRGAPTYIHVPDGTRLVP